MEKKVYHVRQSVCYYVKSAVVVQSNDPKSELSLPIFPDGHPGIMYQQTESGMLFLPDRKKVSALFVYGQTTIPLFLQARGSYRYAVLELYPFALRYLLDIDPGLLANNCYDLLKQKETGTFICKDKLAASDDSAALIEHIFDIIEDLPSRRRIARISPVHAAIHEIISNKGLVKISEVREKANLTGRTFERNFLREVGLTPKQFAKIIQFKCSLNELISNNDEGKISNVAFDSGYADHSHFARVFKKFSGLSPKEYRERLLSGAFADFVLFGQVH